ncbi:Uncharacterized protein HZ326_22275 [Fusarium oxysporum f. sp. albedinis]|nr:Uncharacterized protein HZ326_22275 [Fusarium oxysporum f. sp. albedinis]
MVSSVSLVKITGGISAPWPMLDWQRCPVTNQIRRHFKFPFPFCPTPPRLLLGYEPKVSALSYFAYLLSFSRAPKGFHQSTASMRTESFARP